MGKNRRLCVCIEPSVFVVVTTWRNRDGERSGQLDFRDRAAEGAATRSGGVDILKVSLTARGPIEEGSDHGLGDGLDLGRKAIVQTFTCMTSQEAHVHWGRKR